MSTSQNSPVILEARTFDPGMAVGSVQTFAESIAAEIETAWASGVDLVLLPEFLWMGLEPLIAKERPEGRVGLEDVADVFAEECLPFLQVRLTRVDKAVVLGTAPARKDDGSVCNRAWIMTEGGWLCQDKLHLTPWEAAFSPGQSLRLWHFRGLGCVVIICLDIEVPELAARLRGAGIDLVLCPSATETSLGVERVNRCASARAVELGCHVLVSHLTGSADSELIDANTGLAAYYSPSQAAFEKKPREIRTPQVDHGTQVLRVELNPRLLEMMRRMRSETNPALLGKDLAGIFRHIPLI
jgi:predicted amidohydrolase